MCDEAELIFVMKSALNTVYQDSPLEIMMIAGFDIARYMVRVIKLFLVEACV
ncbi:hypothetical protein NFHSH190041_33610 [Shewanella sp. NFH-SH190041]|nr:hypothetical protein NFHSH190041_33610 [Shewanella sp. NFH-SH190041]